MNAILIVYNTLMLATLCVGCPFWIALVRWRKKYRETFFRRLWMEGLGRSQWAIDSSGGSTAVWIHALSVGEVLSAEPLVRALTRKHGSKHLIFTASTHTGVETAMRVIAPHVRAVRHFPYDTFFSVNRALKVIRPRKMVIVETDVWPNFLYRLNQRKIPVYLVNARLSGRSQRGYKRIDFLMVPLLSMFRRICVQSQRDWRRFLDLGVPGENVIITGNLKFDQTPVTLSTREREQLQAALGIGSGSPVWVAGSTHPHEEEILGEAFQRLRATAQELRLIVAPRDAARATEVCEVFRRLGIQAMTMGQIESRNRSSAAVVVIDRLGMLRKLYALADVAFVGGSLVKAGGHNPLEPASVAIPILFGPYTDDFDWISRTLESAGGAMRISTAMQLSAVIRDLLANRMKCAQIGKIAHVVFERHQGAVERTVAVIGT